MATFEKGKVFEPKALVDYAEGSVVSRELEHNEAGSITVFSFDKGQGLSEHQAPFDALIHTPFILWIFYRKVHITLTVLC